MFYLFINLDMFINPGNLLNTVKVYFVDVTVKIFKKIDTLRHCCCKEKLEQSLWKTWQYTSQFIINICDPVKFLLF